MAESEYIDFNLNHLIKVKLTPQAVVFWRDLDASAYASMKLAYPEFTGKVNTLEHYQSKADAEGFFEMQGWQFIQTFGRLAKNGAHFFDANIKLQKRGFFDELE